MAAMTVTTSPTRLDGPDTDARAGRDLVVRNVGGATVEVGGADVAWGDGVPLDPGETLAVSLAAGQDAYAIAESGTVEVRVWQP